MKETDRIHEQLKQAFEGGAWHGPALLELLDGIGSTIAAARPVSGIHSIWEIVLHLTGTQKLMLRRMRGESSAIELAPDEDWPPAPDPTEANWQETLDILKAGEADLQCSVERLPRAKLDAPLIDGSSSAYNNLHGYVQHMLYHAGQISLLKKAALQQVTERK